MGEIGNAWCESGPNTDHMERRERIVFSISSYDSNAMKSGNPHSGIYVTEKARTLDLNGGNPACYQGGVMILDIRH